MCVTDRHDMTLAVKVALNPNTTNQLSQKDGTLWYKDNPGKPNTTLGSFADHEESADSDQTTQYLQPIYLQLYLRGPI